MPPATTRVHAFGDDALGADDLVGLLRRLARREVSAGELVSAAIARTETVDPHLNGLVVAAFDRARVEVTRLSDAIAREDQRTSHAHPFAGVPTFVKDNADVAGVPTQQGSRAWTAPPAPADGPVATLMHGLGLVALGKTRLPEMGFNPSAEPPGGPPVRNPWDTSRTSGGSSAGSAAFVAAGVVPLAHGNDGGGSIRIPAACCGLVGLKPTRGRTPSEAMSRAMPVKLVADGVLTRSVRDTALFMREAEKLHRDLRLPPVGDVRRMGRKRLRIGLATESVGDRRTHPDCVRAATDLAHLLEGEGHHVDPVDPPVPSTFEDDFVTYWSLLAMWIHDAGTTTVAKDLDRARLDPLTRGLARLAHRRLHRMPQAIARLRRSHRTSADFFAGGYDVVLSPVTGYPAPELGVLRPPEDLADYLPRLTDFVSFTPLANATGDPALTLPTGTSADGNPVGVMLTARHGAEATLLELGYEIEGLRPFRRIQDSSSWA